jgi:hypothetical protein
MKLCRFRKRRRLQMLNSTRNQWLQQEDLNLSLAVLHLSVLESLG